MFQVKTHQQIKSKMIREIGSYKRKKYNGINHLLHELSYELSN